MTTNRVAAILLAAGQGARFRASGGEGPSKLVAELGGKALARHAAEAALSSQARPVILVTGHAEEAVRAALAGLDLDFVHNAEHREGLASSLRAGLAAVPQDCAGAVVLLGDMPGVSGSLIDRLIAAFEAHPGAPAVVPASEGERGNPVLLSRSLFTPAMALSGDRGARKLVDGAGDAVIEIEAGDDARADIDTREALERAQRR